LLTRSHQQEGLARAYVQAVASQAGLIWGRPEQDYGIDLSLRRVVVRENRRRDAGVQLDVQLKSTTRAAVTGAHVTYDLEAEAYHDLREADVPCPRILIVFLMPADDTRWLSQTTEQLTLRHCAYWLSLKGQPPTTATRTVRIAIPLANVFSVEGVTGMMQRVRERKDV